MLRYTSAIALPLPRESVPSAVCAALSGYSPPMPNPSMNRHRLSIAYIESRGESHAQAAPRLASAVMIAVAMKIPRRPSTSAAAPNASWPTTDPNSAALVSIALCLSVAGNSSSSSVRQMFITWKS